MTSSFCALLSIKMLRRRSHSPVPRACSPISTRSLRLTGAKRRSRMKPEMRFVCGLRFEKAVLGRMSCESRIRSA